jgi:MFS transporter, FSR family, fosmidomycin resistance protein
MRKVLSSRLLLLAFGHFTIDAYSSFFLPLLPLLVQKLELSLTLVGTLVALNSLASSLSQPLFGWIAERLDRPWFVAFGPLVAAVFVSAVGVAPTYGALLAVLLIGGLGVSAFHPQAAALASNLSPRRGLAMSVFVTGGTIGFSLGPLYAVSVVGAFGLERTWLAALPGVAVAAVMLAWFARVRPAQRAAGPRPALRELRPVLRPLLLLYFAVVSRSAVAYGFMTLVPLYLAERGHSVASGGALISLYLICGAAGAFLGGWLADRWGGRRVVIASFLGALPLYPAFLLLPERAGIACLVLGSLALQASLPVNVVMGQELSPRHSSTISSLLMGAAWGLGVLVVGPIGALADAVGLRIALLCLSAVLLLGLACGLALPEVRRQALPADLAQPATGAGGR